MWFIGVLVDVVSGQGFQIANMIAWWRRQLRSQCFVDCCSTLFFFIIVALKTIVHEGSWGRAGFEIGREFFFFRLGLCLLIGIAVRAFAFIFISSTSSA